MLGKNKCEPPLNNVASAGHSEATRQPVIFSFHKGFLSAYYKVSFPGGSDGNESICDAGDLGSIPGLTRSSGKYYNMPGTALEYYSKQHKQHYNMKPWGLFYFLIKETDNKQVNYTMPCNKKLRRKIKEKGNKKHWNGLKFQIACTTEREKEH